MKKISLLFVLTTFILAATSCSTTNQSSEANTVNSTVVSESPSFEITSDVVAEEETTESHNGDSITIKEEYQAYYEKFYGLFKCYSDINQPEAILLKMNNIFNEKYKEYDRTVAYESDDFAETMYSNFITPDETVLRYDPLALAFYNNQKKLKANPILTAEKADEKLTGKYTSTEYMPFTYNSKPVEINKDFSGIPSKALSEIVAEYFKISNIISGYSPDEELYYEYIINADGKENAFTITTIFLDADTETGEVNRIGIETYVRTHSEINTCFNKNTNPSAMNTCVTDCLNTPYMSSQYYLNDPDSISESIIAAEHKDFCDIAASLMNAGFTQTNSVKFKLVDDFPSAMNSCMHFHSAHYVSWFTKN